MRIEGTVYGYVNSFGVSLRSGDNIHEKIVHLKVATVNAAELHAAEYALAAISDKTADVELITCNAYLPKMLNRTDSGAYKAKPEKNAELVARVRALAEKFEVFRVTINKTKTLIELQDLVKKP